MLLSSLASDDYSLNPSESGKCSCKITTDSREDVVYATEYPGNSCILGFSVLFCVSVRGFFQILSLVDVVLELFAVFGTDRRR